jgi:mycothiol synthase
MSTPTFTCRAYRGASDLDLLYSFVQAHPRGQIHLLDLPYRLASWAFETPENVSMWLDSAGEVAGWVVLQTPFWTIDLACRPKDEAALLPQMLAWAERRAMEALGTDSGRPAWVVEATPDQQTRIAALEAAGFVDQTHAPQDPWSRVLLARSAAEPLPQVELPEGFKIRPLAGPDETPAYVETHRAAFETTNMTVPWRYRSLQQLGYTHSLDLVITTPHSELGAFCIAWFQEKGPEGVPAGQIEPMGVHPAYQRLGLGQAVLAENLHRLQVMGAQHVYVETDSYRTPALGLYEAFGFKPVSEIRLYRKDFGN